MKKNVGKLLVVALVLTLALALAACNPTGGNQGGDHQGGTVETITYTVTFDTNGGDTSFASYTVKNVPSGGYISAPTRADGSEAIPVKTGYTFKYWSYNSVEFVFADGENPTPVEENITLTAYYEANEYVLTLSPSDEKSPYDGALTIAGVEGQFSEDVDKSVKYDTTATNLSLDVPKTDKADDYFVYWYYYDDKGETAAFTAWATDTSATVQMAAKYTFTHGLTLYPMFHSQLPDYDVVLDAAGGTLAGSDTVTVKQQDYVTTSALPDPTRDGYRFVGWYYETTDDDGEVTEHDFTLYDDVTEDADNDGATKVSASLVTENASGNPSLTLKARWVKSVTVSSAADLEAVRDVLSGDDEAAKAEYASAEYTLAADLTLSDWTALFDETLPFTGVFDGGNHTVTVSSFAANANGAYGLFGFVSGTVKNLKVAAGGIDLPSEAAATYAVGGIAAYAKDATVENCVAVLIVGTVGAPVDFGASDLYVGALVGASKGSVTVTGDGGIGATGDKYSLVSVYALSEGNICAGGVIGGSYDTVIAGGAVKNSDVTVDFVLSASKVYAGGAVGYSQGFTIEKTEVKGGITATASSAVYAGAIVGRTNFGGVSVCSTDEGTLFEINANGGSVYVGGVAGENKVSLDNCRVNAEITVAANGTSVYVGGVTGMERGSSVDSCYVTGAVSVTLDGGVKYAYVGGTTGYDAAATSYSRVYGELNVTVVNDADAALRAGDFVAYNNPSLALSVEKVYYFAGNVITVDGTALSDEDKNVVEDVETLTEEKRAEVPNWAIGGDYLNLDTGYWEMVDGATHPSLKSTVTVDDPETGDGELDGDAETDGEI